MSVNLPDPISAYFEAVNKHDIDAMLSAFDANAVVKDEGEEYHGRTAIREWIVYTTNTYRVTIEVKDVSEASGEVIVSGQVSGTFDGSPLLLDHAFTLSGGKIAQLEIG